LTSATAAEPDNPLIDYPGLPPFSQIEPDHITPAVEAILADVQGNIEQLLEGEHCSTWNNLVAPLEYELDRVARVWAPVQHLHAVASNDEIRAAYNACIPQLTQFFTQLGQHQGLYAAYRALAEGPAYARLTATQQKAIDDALRDFRLAGVDLPPDQRERFQAIENELAELQTRFEDQLLDATNAWRKAITDEAALAGLSDDAKALARAAAEREGVAGWLLTLEFPLFHAVMTTAHDRALRREVYEAWTTRASDQGPHAGRWDNGPLIERIVALRQEKAGLLGYAHYADLALATRMVGSVTDVFSFLNDLAGRALPAAREEVATLQTYASEQLGLASLESWDVGYVSEQLRQDRFQISEEGLKPYFPAPRVIEGLFRVAQQLYGVRIEAVPEVDVWHPDVGFYRILDANGCERGGFYLDLYARPNKRGGAWMDDCIARMPLGDGVRHPVAFLTCNLTPPVDGQPPQFTHDEVITLFHEFGHGLHHLMTLVDVPSLAGIQGVEWDAVELPSQLMENWCWERESLDLIAGHADDGSPLPADLLARLRDSRNFLTALALMRQVEFSLFDFRLHTEYTAPSVAQVQGLLDQVRDQVAMIHPPAFNRFAHGFSHIFAGGYAAGYYSYKWAEVLSADAFEAFEAAGILDRATGEAFLHSVLEQGGSRPAVESFKAFRGREPDPSALLRQSGLAA
jgi:oligopeptidase A